MAMPVANCHTLRRPLVNGVIALAALWVSSVCAIGSQPAIRLYTTADGLVRNWINKIYRDSQGRLWFCTVEGLSLFDGQRFINYGANEGLPHRMVTDLVETGHGGYWLATFGGLFLFQPSTLSPARFQPVPLPGEPVDAQPTVLFKSNAGEVWCGTLRGGLYRIQPGASPRAIGVALSGLNPGEINALAETPDGSMWIGAGNRLIRRKQNGALSSWALTHGLHMVRSLLVDRHGLVWAAGAGQISRIDPRSEPVAIARHLYRDGDPQGDVQCLYQDSNGTIWIGAFGLSKLINPFEGTVPDLDSAARESPETWLPRLQPFDRSSPLGSQFVPTIAEDSAHSLWLGLSNIGVARLMPNFIQYSERDGLESKTVQSVFEGADSELYAISGVAHTLNRFDGKRFQSHPTEAARRGD